MRKIPRTCLAPEDLAVIAYHEDNGDLVILRFSYGQERDIRFAFRCITDYDPVYHAASPAASNLFPQQ